jgi:hypothetical protein
MRRQTTVVVGIAATAGLAAAAAATGTVLWDREVAEILRELAAARPGPRTMFAPELLSELPELVRRYLTFALPPGQPPIARARIHQRGTMRPLASDARWNRFTAVGRFTLSPPGFLWIASMRVAPLLTMRIRDAYVHGRGISQAAVAGVIRFGASDEEQEQLASAALLRFLAESPWIPSALLPSETVHWTAVDERNARVALDDRTTSVSAQIGFGEYGEIVSVAAQRYAGPAFGTLPWVGRFGGYERMSGMMSPTTAEVEWITTDGPVPVWRGRVVGAEYEFA